MAIVDRNAIPEAHHGDARPVNRPPGLVWRIAAPAPAIALAAGGVAWAVSSVPVEVPHLLAGLGTVAVIGLVNLWVARSIVRPVRNVADAMRRLADGKMTVDLSEETAIGEIAAMADCARMLRDRALEHAESEKALSSSQWELRMHVAELDMAKEQLERQGDHLSAMAEDLVVARDAAEASNLAKSEFLATVSHEIRTPLNGVLGMANVVLNSDLSDVQREQVAIIESSGRALSSLLDDILDISKIEAGQLEIETVEFDLHRLLSVVDEHWRPHLERAGLHFSIDVAPDLSAILHSDPTRLRQILFNLISNAAKFTESGGVTVAVTQRHLPGDDTEIRFEVTDTGIGIGDTAKPFIFSRFTQADSSTTRKYGGTGLGLAICKELSELLGGEIGFTSTEGAGSTFWFTVRCAAEAAKNSPTTKSMLERKGPAPDEPVGALRILVAEDNTVNQAVARALLEKAGHRIDIVSDGAEAVAAVTRTPYDLVLMDVQMSTMDGITATQKIREWPGEASGIPIIALTANAMKGNRETYIAAGMNDYVAKPIDPKELLATIAKWGGSNSAAGETSDPETADPAGANASAVLDRQVLDRLSDGVGKEAMPDLVVQSVADMRASLDRLIELGDVADLEELQREAHDLKSTSGGFGALRLHSFARALDLACKEGRAEDARRLVSQIGPIAQEAFEALEGTHGLRQSELQPAAMAR